MAIITIRSGSRPTESVTIDSNSSVICTGLTRKFNKLSDSSSGRTQDGSMHINLIGTYFNYTLTLRRPPTCSMADWDKVWNIVSYNEPWTQITMPYNQGTITYDAYITSGEQKLRYIKNGKTYWDSIDLEFIAKEPILTAPTVSSNAQYVVGG